MGSSQEETSLLLDLLTTGAIGSGSLTPEEQVGVIEAILRAYQRVTKYLPGKPLAEGNLVVRTSATHMPEDVVPSPKGEMTDRNKVIYLYKTSGSLPTPAGWYVADFWQSRLSYFFWDVTSNKIAVAWHYSRYYEAGTRAEDMAHIGTFSGADLAALFECVRQRDSNFYGTLVSLLLHAGEKAVEERRKVLAAMESAQERAASIAARICVR